MRDRERTRLSLGRRVGLSTGDVAANGGATPVALAMYPRAIPMRVGENGRRGSASRRYPSPAR